jgi:hypothetical protein
MTNFRTIETADILYYIHKSKTPLGPAQFVKKYGLSDEYNMDTRFQAAKARGFLKKAKKDPRFQRLQPYQLTAKGINFFKESGAPIMTVEEMVKASGAPNSPYKKSRRKSPNPALTTQAAGAVNGFVAALEEGQQAMETVRQMINIGQAFLSTINKEETNEH